MALSYLESSRGQGESEDQDAGIPRVAVLALARSARWQTAIKFLNLDGLPLARSSLQAPLCRYACFEGVATD